MSMTTKQWTKSDELQRKKFYLAEADGIVMPVPISFHSTTRSLSPSLLSYLFFLLGCISLCTLLFTLCCCCCCSTASSSLFFSIFFSSSVVAIVKNAMLELHLRSFTWSKCNHSAILASCRHTRTIVLLLLERVKKVNGQKHRNKLSPGLKIDLQFLFPTQRNGMARFLILQMLSH